MATHSSTLAWKIPWTEETGGLQSMGSHSQTRLKLLSSSSSSNAFHTAHGVLKARILRWFAIPFCSGPRFVRTLHHDLPIFGGPTWHGS